MAMSYGNRREWQLFEVVTDVVATALVHTQLTEGGSLGVDNQYEFLFSHIITINYP